MYFDSTSIDIIITVFMALSAMHFGVIFAIVAGRSFKPLKHSVTKYYLGIIAVCSIIIALSLKTQGGYESWGGALLDSTFQTVSYLTTTGFGQADNAMWPLLANTILIFAAMHCGCAREPKRTGEARTAHPPASRLQDSSREGPVWQALSGHKRSNTLAVELPPQARGTGTLIPSVRRLVWAGKHQLGNAAWGASFPSERALPAGGFGSVHTPSP